MERSISLLFRTNREYHERDLVIAFDSVVSGTRFGTDLIYLGDDVDDDDDDKSRLLPFLLLLLLSPSKRNERNPSHCCSCAIIFFSGSVNDPVEPSRSYGGDSKTILS